MLLTLLGVSSMIFVVVFTAYNYRAGNDMAERREALVEAWTNIIIGFAINFVANLVLIPLMSKGGTISPLANFWGGWVYTTIALIRQYAIRRWFSKHLHKVQAFVLKLWSML